VTNPDTNEPNDHRFAIPLWMWAATVAALLIFAATLWQAKKLRGQLTELQVQMRAEQGRKATLEAQRQEMEQIRELLAAPETGSLLMEPTSPEMPSIRIFWNKQIGLLVTSQKVPAIPAGSVFQLWVVPKKGNAISVGAFHPEANGTVLSLLPLHASVRIEEAASLTITMEPAVGSSIPTGSPSWIKRID
jgi:hypothetical protein